MPNRLRIICQVEDFLDFLLKFIIKILLKDDDNKITRFKYNNLMYRKKNFLLIFKMSIEL